MEGCKDVRYQFDFKMDECSEMYGIECTLLHVHNSNLVM